MAELEKNISEQEMPMILCENLVKIYKTKDSEVLALQGLELQVERGRIARAAVFSDAMAWELPAQIQQALEGKDFSLPAMQESLLFMETQPEIREDLSRMLAEQEI